MRQLLLALAALCASSAITASGEPAKLLRFPHVQGDKIAFCYGGDLWTASVNGGVARRVTSFDQGYEVYPRISPDGNWIAFSGEYGGTRQLFVVPYAGGEPRQLTFYPDVGPADPRHGYDNLPMDWTADGRILFRTARTPYSERIGKYFTIDPKGGLEQPLQVPEGGPATLSPDGKKLAYNIISTEWRGWKRYKAGRSQDVFTYDLEANAVKQLTDFEGADNFPMWIGERIYFTSDRTGTLNLFCIELGSGPSQQVRQVTSYTDYDVLFPSRGGDRVIFEKGGELFLLDTKTDQVKPIPIELADDKPWHRPVWKTGKGNFATFDVAPHAKRAFVEVRGEVFSVPEKKGEPTDLTNTPARREREVHVSPDGKTLAYLAEVGDDYELFLKDLATGAEKQATKDTGAWIIEVAWSPDSKRIALTDRALRLRVLDVATLGVVDLDRGTEDLIGDLAWSADSGWLAYVKQSVNTFHGCFVCPADRAEPHDVTGDHFENTSPAFDPEGRYLYFVSARDFDYGQIDFDSRIFALTLRKDVKSPIAFEEDVEPKADEAAKDPKKDDEKKPEEKKDETKKDEPKKDEVKPLVIDFDGLAQRIVALPLPSGNYGGLLGIKGALLFRQGNELKKYDVEKREAKTVLAGAGGYAITPDFKKILYRRGDDLCLADVAPGQTAGDNPLPLDRVHLKIDPQTEWAQIYGDAWRIMRDWFYDPGMHHVDWKAMREKYRPLVAHVAHRDDLDFLIGEMISELNVGHAYVHRGESPRVPAINVGLLGCELKAEGERYRIAKILHGEPWNESTRAPLDDAGVDVKEGDFLLAIDGAEVKTSDNPYRFLENKAGALVKLKVNAQPTLEGAREVTVKPCASERDLFNMEWVARSRALVDKLSGGRIGYVYVPDTAAEGHRELWKDFRPQARVKDAMIIDDRYNGGGNIPERMIQSISMPVLSYWSRRYAQLDVTPNFAFEGPMAMLINGYSSSGGDCFPFYFREMKRGPLIGKKTWGGLVGYSGTPNFVDGGGLAVPAFAFVNPQGQWDVEGVGVRPDIDVFDDPGLIQAGRDPSLERAVTELLQAIEKNPTKRRPPVPAGPDKSH